MTIRWGILGCGAVCEVKSGPAFQKARGSELVAVMRRNAALAEDFARRHGVARAYSDAAQLIADPNVDAVYIATPPGSHLELALLVAAAGKPAYVEKPMARTHAECERMIAAFERAKVPLFVAYYRRALERFRIVKQLLDAGQLGEVRSIAVRYISSGQSRLDPQQLPWRVQAEHSGGGLFLDLASHTLDVLDFLFGPLENVSGHASREAAPTEVEDRVTLAFTTRSGARGSGLWNFSSASYEDSIVIEGSAGTLSVATFGDTPIEVRTSAGTRSLEAPNPAHIQQPLIQSIVDELSGTGTCPSTGRSAARTSAVMDQALLSYYGTREGDFWKRAATWPGLCSASNP